MGRDKAFIELDGRPLVLGAIEALEGAGADEIVCIGGDLARLTALGLDARPDLHPGQGPLGGLITAVAEVTQDLVMLLSCDLVAPSPDAVARVVTALGAEPAADAAVPVVGGRRQVLHAAYRRSAGSRLRSAFDDGERSIDRVLEGLRVIGVPGLAPAALADADSPSDLSSATDTLSISPPSRPEENL